ncbi:MAG: response regulator [Sediminicola sp.]|tara:strand:- start:19920 stop:20381 length:462 start_codon:yes stop_codon:yes gene_type:complete
MDKMEFRLLVADDDEDDLELFNEALADLDSSTLLVTVRNGIQLMEHLSERPSGDLPDILFLDLNMPLKDGLECLSEIRSMDGLRDLPIVIFSTSLDMDMADILYKKGAHFYIQKPNEFAALKKVIDNSLTYISEGNFEQPTRDLFVLQNQLLR